MKAVESFSESKMSEFFIDYSDLDDFQRKLIDSKTDKSMVITGSAGSGKSLIALHKARQIKAKGDSFAIIVYTKTLQKYFSAGLKQLNLPNVFGHWEWKNPWHGPSKHVKYLIVDECQDFTKEEIDEMKQSCDYCLFFGDTAQSIMNFPDRATQAIEQTAFSLNVVPEKLYFNYRLTKQIAALAEKVGEQQDLIISCKREGEKPNIISAGSYDEQLDKIAEIIKNRHLTNVGILLPGNVKGDKNNEWSVEYVKDYLKNKGFTCEYKYNANKKTEMDLNFESENPKIMTWWCAKGLQFKDVFIPGCERYTNNRAALYVAMTRASERLYLGYTNALSNLFPSTNDPVYNQNSFNNSTFEEI